MTGTVRWFRTISVAGLVLLWALATNHCQLETISGLDFLSCASEETRDHHESSDCDSDGCATIESGLYKFEDSKDTIPDPRVMPAWMGSIAREDTALARELPGEAAPHEWLRSPQTPRAFLTDVITPRAPCPIG